MRIVSERQRYKNLSEKCAGPPGQSERYGEDDGRRHEEAFIQRAENQVDEHDADDEDPRGGVTRRGLLAQHAAEFEAVTRREGCGGHRQSKLGVERAGRASDEAYGDEDGHEDERRGDEGRGDAVHGVERGAVGRTVPFVELGLHGLDDHDGVVDHRTDDQYQGEERQHVQTEARGVEKGERAYERFETAVERAFRRIEVRRTPVTATLVVKQEYNNVSIPCGVTLRGGVSLPVGQQFAGELFRRLGQ